MFNIFKKNKTIEGMYETGCMYCGKETDFSGLSVNKAGFTILTVKHKSGKHGEMRKRFYCNNKRVTTLKLHEDNGELKEENLNLDWEKIEKEDNYLFSRKYWKRYKAYKTIKDINEIRKILDKNPNAPYPDNTGIYIDGISYQRDTYVSGGSIFPYPRGMTWIEFVFTQGREPMHVDGEVKSYHDYEDSYDRRQ